MRKRLAITALAGTLLTSACGGGESGTVQDTTAAPAAGGSGTTPAAGTGHPDTTAPPGYTPVRDETQKDSIPSTPPAATGQGSGTQP